MKISEDHLDKCKFWDNSDHCDCGLWDWQENEKWKARFLWLIDQFWFIEEANHRLNLAECESNTECLGKITAAIDAKLVDE